MAWKRIACAAVLVVSGSVSASADWNSFWHRFHVDYQRNNAWPHPFREMDAMQTRSPFEVQKMNGWRLNNTISHELFREGDGALTYAGQRQLVQITTNVPPEHRAVFVVRGANQAETDARVAAVKNSLERMNHGEESIPQIMVIDRAPATSSGALASAINRAWMEELPAPKLPADEGPSVSGD